MRRVLALILTTCAATALLAAPAGAVTVGIGSETDGFLSDQLFTALHINHLRVVVPWNMMTSRSQHPYRVYFDNYLKSAHAAHMDVLVSFGADTQKAGNIIPSQGSYSKAVKAFIHAYPWVKEYTPWNEPDWVYRPGIADHPGRAAGYFNDLVRACHHCKILAGDVYLPASQLSRWLPGYIRGLHYKPYGWALHNYYDVRTHKTSQLRALERLTSGPIWLTEISGVERRGHWQYKNQSANAAGRDEKFLFSLPKKNHRVARIYHYQWYGASNAGWDSGLIADNGSPRPAYFVLEKASHH